MDKMICTKCQEEKEVTQFEFRKDSQSYRKQCKSCRRNKIVEWQEDNKEYFSEHQKKYKKKYNKHYRVKNKDKLDEYNKQYYKDNKESMDAYKKEWDKKNKSNEKRKPYFKQYGKDNRYKITQYNKEWNKLNPEKQKQYRKDYIEKNPEYVEKIKVWSKEYNKQYAKDNRESIRLNKRKYENHRRATDTNYKIKCNLRTRMYSVLIGRYKSDSTMELIGCSLDELKKHLEKNFTPEMNWDNYGTYFEIDHVKPCATFDLTSEEEQKKCFNYRNLQPLELSENRSKRERMQFKDIVF